MEVGKLFDADGEIKVSVGTEKSETNLGKIRNGAFTNDKGLTFTVEGKEGKIDIELEGIISDKGEIILAYGKDENGKQICWVKGDKAYAD